MCGLVHLYYVLVVYTVCQITGDRIKCKYHLCGGICPDHHVSVPFLVVWLMWLLFDVMVVWAAILVKVSLVAWWFPWIYQTFCVHYVAKGARGVEIVPSYHFWKDYLFLIKVGQAHAHEHQTPSFSSFLPSISSSPSLIQWSAVCHQSLLQYRYGKVWSWHCRHSQGEVWGWHSK